jgi:hypothetical protein
MHMVSTIVIVQQCGLPEILPFSATLMLFRGTYNTMPVPQPLHNIPDVTLVAQSGPTPSGSHQLMTFVL